MPAEFDCEGCGYSIVSFVDPLPSHGFCAICAWLCEYDPKHVMERRRQCEPGGWESERDRRRKRELFPDWLYEP